MPTETTSVKKSLSINFIGSKRRHLFKIVLVFASVFSSYCFGQIYIKEQTSFTVSREAFIYETHAEKVNVYITGDAVVSNPRLISGAHIVKLGETKLEINSQKKSVATKKPQPKPLEPEKHITKQSTEDQKSVQVFVSSALPSSVFSSSSFSSKYALNFSGNGWSAILASADKVLHHVLVVSESEKIYKDQIFINTIFRRYTVRPPPSQLLLG